MCGLAGIIGAAARDGAELERLTQLMTGPIRHRGPDDDGVFVVPESGVALGFRRLAIIDLSPAGHQPMASRSDRFTLVFNGEVFNHNTLRGELLAEGHRFRGHSDTEVILAAFESWGIRASVKRFVGMFAIAVWDRETRSLTLIRDRLGIKPVFYARAAGGVAFASELKSLAGLPGFQPRLDRRALSSYLRFLYVPAPATIYEDVYKLPPGHLLTLTEASADLPAPEAYWSATEAAEAGADNPLGGSDAEVVEQFDGLIKEAVRLRLEADVPLGALLSGGIDSSTVVALMQELLPRPARTFTIGFDRPEHDEADHARAIAKHLGTEHTELRLTGADALAVVPKLPEMFDEPLADPSSIPTYLVSGLARQHVTVALTGDGGDELFGGYNRYRHGARLSRRLDRIPASARQAAAAAIGALRPGTWDRLSGMVGQLMPVSSRPRLVGERLDKLARLLRAGNTASRYRMLMSFWDRPDLVVRGVTEPGDELDRILGAARPATLEERMMLADQRGYLADDLLAKVDRASMAVSLEARVPLLDHRLVEFAWRLPLRFKIRDGQGKWILRQVLYRRVPRQLVDRPKMGFTVPISDWLRGPLRDWAESLLTREALDADGVLDPAPIREAWARLLDGRSPNATALWAVLTFQDWRRRWRPRL